MAPRKIGTRRENLEKQTAAKNRCPCSFRDLMGGFWIGLALAALYVNGKQQPNPMNSPSGKTAVTSTSPSSTGGGSEKAVKTPSSGGGSISSKKIPLVVSREGQKDFYKIGKRTGTDKVWGPSFWDNCKQDIQKCPKPAAVNPQCKVRQGHFYHTIYNKWLGPYSTNDAEPFQFLEIGFYTGNGFDAYIEFMPKGEAHSIEVNCLEPGPRAEGKWPWGNQAKNNPRYQEYLDNNKLHCGDANDINYLNKVWTTNMKRPNSPPLKVVIEDASHLAEHMATTLFYWFPRIEPGGLLIVEDIEPITEANKFRTDVLPQVMKDLHYCGDPTFKDKACFPTIWPLLQSIHCEMHICVFERNNEPAKELTLDLSKQPPNTLKAAECLFESKSK